MAQSRPQRRYHLRFGGLVYLAASLVVGVAALNSQANLLFWAFGLMMGAVLVSGYVNGRMLSGLAVERVGLDPGVVGEAITVRYRVTNRHRWTPCFGLIFEELGEYGESGVERLGGKAVGYLLHLAGGHQGYVQTVARAELRGAVRFRRLRVSTTFPMGLMRKSVTFALPGETVIYPVTYRIRHERLARAVSMQMSGVRSSQKPGGSEEFFGLREYRAGDSVRLIDWKHTARTGTVMRRELTRLRPPRLIVVVDVRGWLSGGLDKDAGERAISFAGSIACDALGAGIEVGMRVVGAACGEVSAGGSLGQRRRVLTALAGLAANGVPGDGAGRVDDAGGAGRVGESDAGWLVVHAGAADDSIGPAGAVRVTLDDVPGWRLNQDAGGESGVGGSGGGEAGRVRSTDATTDATADESGGAGRAAWT